MTLLSAQTSHESAPPDAADAALAPGRGGIRNRSGVDGIAEADPFVIKSIAGTTRCAACSIRRT
jgi:hypothetical protein